MANPKRELFPPTKTNVERDRRWAELQDSVWREVFLRTSMDSTYRNTEPWKIIQIAQEKADETLTHLKRPKHLENLARTARDPL